MQLLFQYSPAWALALLPFKHYMPRLSSQCTRFALNQLTDAEGYSKDYLPKGRAAILAHGGLYVAAGKGTVITGDVPHDRVVVLRFESLDAVKAWFNSPDYQAANQIGQKYAHYNIIAVDGVPTKQ